MKLDRTQIARAGAALAKRVVGGAMAGTLVGVIAFAVERGAGVLGTSGWAWLLVPCYAVAGAIVGAYLGWILGKRRAATMLLIDTGVVADLTRRALAGEPAELQDGGSRLVRWAKQLAQQAIALVLAYVGVQGDPVADVQRRVTSTIAEWGRIGAIIALVVLAAVYAIVPVMIRGG